ncbi:hypothetical protein F0223_23745 [Vibrio coralliilyticus]|uniref:hypothetical protein n=1 Tax=Vibrio TaxID=662 RepID=UPI0005020283|nr:MULTISPECIES: hypothetical protein [Vibrio]KFI12032.1 hypothetical protein IX95_10300 [Vibrio sp. B183]NOI21215.1 hypothetical protein [Vibrio coralliilyticus]
MNWKQPNHTFTPLKNAQLVDYHCRCQKGVFHVDRSEKRLAEHNQIPHRCTACKALAYFTVPYPMVVVNEERFVHWETIKGEQIQENK